MPKQIRIVLPVIVVAILALGSCRNFPKAVQAPELSSDDIANTAVAKVFAGQTAAAPAAADIPVAEELPAPTVAPNPTACGATVTALTNANVRGGPGTDYDVVGNLPIGATAPVAGRNGDSSWWYIQFAGGSGGFAWIAASVVSSACIPPALQVVAGPPLPTATPTGVWTLPLQQLRRFPSPTPTNVWTLPLQQLRRFPSPTPTLVH